MKNKLLYIGKIIACLAYLYFFYNTLSKIQDKNSFKFYCAIITLCAFLSFLVSILYKGIVSIKKNQA